MYEDRIAGSIIQLAEQVQMYDATIYDATMPRI
jgi:hypothetical protein